MTGLYDEQLALDHIETLEALKLTGDFYGQPFTLLDWQRDVISNVYGTVDEAGRRRYKYAYLEIPKKNGKTELIASLAVDHALNDEPGGQIYCCAAEREQASLVYMAAKSKIEQDSFLSKYFRVIDSKKEIHNRETGTFIKVLSAEAYSKHGLNPSVIIFDELHALQKRDLWDVMTYGSGAARTEQLVWIITTAGDDPDRKSVGWEQHEYASKVRDGEIEDPTWFVRIYGAPDDTEDIYDEDLWYRCNPSLGVTIPIENVREEAQKAKNSESAEKLFRWLRLNQWISLKRVGWLPLTLWDETEDDGGMWRIARDPAQNDRRTGTGDGRLHDGGRLPADQWLRDSMRGRECYVGLDLSSTTDLTASAALFPPADGDTWYFFLDAFIPENNMPERIARDHVPFDQWVREGYVHATPGDCVDYACVARHLELLVHQYDVHAIAADKWRIDYLAQQMDTEIADKKIVTIPQTIEGMSPAMKETERMMRGGELKHGKNPCGRWSFGNVIVAMDGNENLKPHKGRSIDRIDPIVALINAMAAAIRLYTQKSVYERRGLRSL